MESTKSTAYAFMIMLAGLAMIGYLGRASAEVAAPGAYESAPGMSGGHAPGVMGQGPYQAQYGLIQTGVVGVAQLDATGGFGRPAAMPIFQVVQLQPAAFAASGQASLGAAPSAVMGAESRSQTSAMPPVEPTVPQGMSVSPPSGAQMTATLCNIKGVQALTQSADACTTAGGHPATP